MSNFPTRIVFLTDLFISLNVYCMFERIVMIQMVKSLLSLEYVYLFLTIGAACSSGYYSLGGNTACIPCPGGYQCSSASSNPVLCTAGNYANNGSTSCTPCAAGYYCPTDGLSEPLTCPTGYYQTSTGQTSCTQCAQGKTRSGSHYVLFSEIITR